MFFNLNNSLSTTSRLSLETVNNVVDDVRDITPGHSYGYTFKFNNKGKVDRKSLINTFRTISRDVEVDRAINYIIDDTINVENGKKIIELDFDAISNVKLTDSVKDAINEQFEYVLQKFNLKNDYFNILKEFYIDGVCYYHVIRKNGEISKLVKLDPLKMSVVNEVTYKNVKGVKTIDKETKIYEYDLGNQTLKIPAKDIIYTDVGHYKRIRYENKNIKIPISYIFNSIKYANSLHHLEDALVVYRIVNGVERQVHYVDVGNRPPQKAEKFLKDYVTATQNKIEYNTDLGKIESDKRHMAMTQNIYVPRTGNSGSAIETIGGNTTFLSDMSDIEYNLRKLYKSLFVPITRLESDQNSSWFGRPSEITKDEVNFKKFIDRFRNRWDKLLLQALRIQLLSNKIIDRETFNSIKDQLGFIYAENNYFSQLKDIELFGEKVQTLSSIDEYIGEYFSKEFVYKKVFQMSDDEIKIMQDQIDQERKAGEFDTDEEE